MKLNIEIASKIMTDALNKHPSKRNPSDMHAMGFFTGYNDAHDVERGFIKQTSVRTAKVSSDDAWWQGYYDGVTAYNAEQNRKRSPEHDAGTLTLFAIVLAGFAWALTLYFVALFSHHPG